MSQISIFDGHNEFKFTKPIRLITFFSGYDSQNLALNYLGIEHELYKTCEWAVKSIQALKDIHFADDNTDYSKDHSDYFILHQLTKWGISSNYNEPMTKEQIKRLGVIKQRQIYNNIKATRNLVNIQQVKGSNLEIYDTDKYDYIITYSFPCQDLSKAGKGKGMAKDSGTRSGMLWEVERILDECHELGQMPKVLLMENVPDVIGTKNIKHFRDWRDKLESLGYKCYYKVLNAKDYGIPQNRERCFMVSILGDYYYQFPEKIKLKKRLKDLLEETVEEKYYLSEKIIDFYRQNSIKNEEKGNGFRFTPIESDNANVSKCITTRAGGRMDDNYIKEPQLIEPTSGLPQAYRVYDTSGLSVSLVAGGGGVGAKTGLYLEPKVIFGIGEKKSNGGTQWYQQDQVYDDNIAISVTTAFNPYYKDNLRIRKLTPKECFRLMGVRDEDFDKVAKNQSNASLYHLAGDSIVVNVLMAIFKEML